MANRRSRPPINSPKALSGDQAAKNLTTNELLRYLAKPLHLPHFNFSTITAEHFLIQTIRKLLIEATLDKVFPDKVLGVQFIFAKRTNHVRKKNNDEVEGNFSFPLLLCCTTRKQALGISDGMSYVTSLLMNKKSSFHLRIRKFKLIHAPAVCVFSSSKWDKRAEFDATNVLWVQLPKSNGSEQIIFPIESLEYLDRNFGDRHFYQADLNHAIQQGNFDERKKSSVMLHPAKFSVRTVGESHLSIDPFRSERLEDLRLDIARDIDYLERVSYLLNFGDVILCAPHAYEIRSNISDVEMRHSETIIDAGLTVITDRTKGKITEDDWLRVQAVAQKLAIFAGAAVSTATESRESILKTLNDVFAHEFSNASTAIVAILDDLRRKNAPLSLEQVRSIQGRLHFTHTLIDSSVQFYEDRRENLDRILSSLVKPMQKYHDLNIEDLDYAPLGQCKVMGLWQLVLAEALRNAYKHCQTDSKDNRKNIHICIQNERTHVTVSIKNRATRDFVLDPDREGWSLMQRIASSLNGDVTPGTENDLFSVNIIPNCETN